jgi:hypothetical protein
VRRYGLGIAKPFPIPLTAHLRSRYLKRSRTIGDLARQAGIDAHGLDNTIAAFNVNAREGWGSRVSPRRERIQPLSGRSGAQTNPCLASIEHSPFYAVKIYLGDLGTSDGLKTHEAGQELRFESVYAA